MSYIVEDVPTFLLYDALSWCIKNDADYATFYRTQDGVRVNLVAFPAQMMAELKRRETEPQNPLIRCTQCSAVTDGRSSFTPGSPLCPPCYWAVLKGMATGTGSPYKNKVIILPLTPTDGKGPSMPKVPRIETRDEIAERIGVPLDMLEENGFFD